MSSRLLGLMLVCAAPKAALAAEPCAAVRFIEPVRLEVRSAVTAACIELEAERADPSVSIDVREASAAAGGLISILATSADGREAFRSVGTPEAAATSVIALLLLPARTKDLTVSPTTASKTKPAASVGAPIETATTAPTVDVVSSAGQQEAVTFGGSVLGATHVGFGEGASLGVGVSGTADVTLDEAWVLGAHARIEPASFNLDREQVGGTFGGGPEAAYRFAVGEAALIDLGVGADVLAAVASYRDVDGDEPGGSDAERRGGPDDDAQVDVRARVFGKVAFPTPMVSLVLLAGVDVSPVAIADGRRGRDENVLAPVGLELGIGIGFRSDELAGGGP